LHTDDDEKFEDTKWVIRSRKSKKGRRTNSDLQSITQKTKDSNTKKPRVASVVLLLALAIRCWLKVDYCFPKISHNGLVYYIMCEAIDGFDYNNAIHMTTSV